MLYIASDHAGYQLKKRIIRHLKTELQQKVEDLGPLEFDEKDDYPDYAIPLARKVVETGGKGILICGNGVGVCIAANKIKGVRAGIGYNLYAAETMRTDDDTNILCLGARALGEDFALAVVKKWLATEFSSEERHKRRLRKIEDLDNKIAD
jgi:ribose 5-phosphate isomerase B